jgi:enoyl-CoA hydratase/carnithine racemase
VTDHVNVDKSGGVLTLTLNRPEKKNALTADMYAALGAAIDGAADAPDVRCIVLQGNGDSFTAGNDLSEFAAINSGVRERAGGNPLISALARTSTPIVAAVQGRAVGVGTTMLLHCDLVFVTEDTLLSTPFVNLALVPEAASSLLLPARIGHARAFAMFVLGEPIDGHTAVRWGIANAVVPAAELRPRARAAAETIAARPPAAVALTKRLMRQADVLTARIGEENRHFAAQLQSPEAREAFAAFRDKRAPDFSTLPLTHHQPDSVRAHDEPG